MAIGMAAVMVLYVLANPGAAMAVIHGLGDCRHRTPDVLDLAQAGTSSVSLPCAPSELTYGAENPRL